MEKRIVFHVDFDYFYAQCEEIRDSKIKGKCVAVCIFSDRGGDSGAIATANYNARKFGVRSGIPIILAKNKLKEQDSVFLPADFDYYSEVSSKAMGIIEKYADVFEYVGRDEAYLDVTKKTEPAFTSGSLILACAASSSEYSLNFSSHNLKTFDEFEFQMVARNETDNACNVPEKGLSGTISFVPSSGLAIIEVPLTEQSGKSFFWHEVFGIGYNVDINFDFSKNVGVGDNAELKLYQ